MYAGCAIRAASGKTKEEATVELMATATQPVLVWAPIRAAGDLQDAAWC
jgi:hypothetical protein